VLIPAGAYGVDEGAAGGMMMSKGEGGGLEECQRAGRVGPASSGEEDPEATVGVAHEMGTVAHQLGDVLGITQEVFAVGGRAAVVAPPIGHEEAEAFVGEGSLGLPLVAAGRQRAVDEHDGRAGAPRLGGEVGRAGAHADAPVAMVTAAEVVSAKV
jgi:hypothetical protein